ncbi:MAG: methylase involved in ubiquinone/menaquinone biosynthesis [Edaphobacter sp.]|nr:methylase involved in ubiquinone/menaquinone biosynthesis [Edaphobacter sp.]
MNHPIQLLRTETFSKKWPLDQEISAASATQPSHNFLKNPSGQYLYVYLTRFVMALSEQHFGCPFSELSVLDWGCGKGQVSKLMRDLGPKHLESCDVLSDKDDSSFGQETPILEQFNIQVTPLKHEYILPYSDASFDVLLSVGVLEHVPNERASLLEITRVLKPGGLFFCFFLPTNLSWTQKLAHLRGNYYHDRFYNESSVRELIASVGLELVDVWYRQLFPKNSVHYPNFRLFERIDQFMTENTLLRYFATNVEFVSVKPCSKT